MTGGGAPTILPNIKETVVKPESAKFGKIIQTVYNETNQIQNKNPIVWNFSDRKF